MAVAAPGREAPWQFLPVARFLGCHAVIGGISRDRGPRTATGTHRVGLCATGTLRSENWQRQWAEMCYLVAVRNSGLPRPCRRIRLPGCLQPGGSASCVTMITAHVR
jgi:hypothetical protein